MTNQNQEILNQEEQVNAEETQAQQTGQKDSDAATSCAATSCAATSCATTETTTTTEEQPAGQVDLFSMMGIEPPPVKKKPAKKNNACGATATAGKGKGTTKKAREIPKDLPIKVVLVNDNVQKDYPAGKSLEEIRQELEMEYPYLTKNNTKWDWEVQKVVDGKVVYDETEKKEDRNDNSTPTPDEEGVTKRILAIPTAKSNKAG